MLLPVHLIMEKLIGANVAGLALGLLTGTFVVSTGHDLVSNINSDIASDSLNHYFASKEYLVALNLNGKVVWKTKLPTGTSSSTLFYTKDTIYMINMGEAKYNGRTSDYGKPYLAAYDKKTGNQLFMNNILQGSLLLLNPCGIPEMGDSKVQIMEVFTKNTNQGFLRRS